MPPLNGKLTRTHVSKCFVSNAQPIANVGIRRAIGFAEQSSQGKVMHSVISIAAVPKTGTSYVRCPSCQAKVQKVHDVVARMVWDRFRCKCGYDGPLEYIASIGNSRKKASGA